MGLIISELLVILALLVLNGIFAMSELAIVSAKKVRLEQRAERGDAGARAALALAADSAGFLSTVQVGITLIGVIASVFGGATIAAIIARQLATVPWLAEHAQGVSLTIVVAGITFLSLIVGELVPKRIALADPERVAALVARPMRLVARLAAPLVRLLTGASNLLLRLFGLHGRTDPGLTEEEIHALVEQGAESGVVPQAEHEMVEGVFRLGDRHVAAIMTPRPDVAWIDASAGALPGGLPAGLREALVGQGRRHLLVCDGELDRPLGIAYLDDMLRRCVAGDAIDLRQLAVKPLFVPAGMPVLRLLEVMRAGGQEVAVALDEYGGLAGVVDLEDILEEIVGQLPSRSADAPPLALAADGSWTAAGGTLVADIEVALDLAPLDVTSERGFRSVGGFMMSHLGRVPIVGDRVEHDGHTFVVERMDGRRVAQVRITRTRGT